MQDFMLHKNGILSDGCYLFDLIQTRLSVTLSTSPYNFNCSSDAAYTLLDETAYKCGFIECCSP